MQGQARRHLYDIDQNIRKLEAGQEYDRGSEDNSRPAADGLREAHYFIASRAKQTLGKRMSFIVLENCE